MSVRERSDVGLPRHAALVGGAGQPPAVNGGLGEPIFWLWQSASAASRRLTSGCEPKKYTSSPAGS